MAALTDAADEAFETAAEVARSLTPSTDDRLRLYGLYKQSTCGAVTTGRPYVVTAPIPLNMFFDVEPSTHFIDLGISDGVRGGHIYGAFLFWSFLANHAGQPGAVGKMYSVDLGAVGELLKLRALLVAEGLDLGDVFANFVAHLRTVDVPLFADEISKMIETSFAIEEDLCVHLGPAVVNSVLPDLDDLDRDLATLAAESGLDLTDNERTALTTAAGFRAGRLRLQREQLDRLGAVLPLDQIRLPHRFGSSIGPSEIAELATVLIAAIEALPEEGDE